jgi:hypothetical protein
MATPNDLIVNDPDFFRSRAEQVRTLAEKMDDPEARRVKRMMLGLASGYEKHAMRAEARLAGKAEPKISLK